MIRFGFGAGMLVLIVVAARAGLQWYWVLVNSAVALLVLMGRRRIFHPGITRTFDEISCRYVPWFEGNVYCLVVLLPGFGIAATAAAFAPGNPVWLLLVGPVLLGLTPLLVFATVRMWRRCLLHITPSTLTVRLAAPKDAPVVLTRESVESVTPRVVANGVGGSSLQVEVAYREGDPPETRTLLLGLQLTVKPINLLNALAYWESADERQPGELMDAVDLILHGGGRPAPDARPVRRVVRGRGCRRR